MYSITIEELIQRPVIRNNFNEEWMNKMTDEELDQFDKEAYASCIERGTPERFPDLNAAYLSCHIDRCILYKLLKEKI